MLRILSRNLGALIKHKILNQCKIMCSFKPKASLSLSLTRRVVMTPLVTVGSGAMATPITPEMARNTGKVM